MDVSVVVNTRNRPDRLRLLMSALARQQGLAGRLEVIVVDDGSDEDLSPALEGFDDLAIRLIRQPPRGYAAARNAGVRNATGTVILCVDDDVVFAPDFVAAHLRVHRAHDSAVVVGDRFNTYLTDLDSPAGRHALAEAADGRWDEIRKRSRRDYFANQTLRVFDTHPHGLPLPWLCFVTRNVSFRRADAARVGHFDEGFRQWGLEDLELGYRMHLAAVPYHYVADARVYHLETPIAATKLDALRMSLKHFASVHPGVESVMLERFLFGLVALEEFSASVTAGREVALPDVPDLTHFRTQR